MGFRLDDPEWEVLEPEDPWLLKIYCLIRKHMDYATGISGKKRKLGERYFIESLSQGSSQGKKKVVVDRNKVNRLLDGLADLGLIDKLGNSVFFCKLATRDDQVSEKSEHYSNTNSNRSTNRGSNKKQTKERSKKDYKYASGKEFDDEKMESLEQKLEQRFERRLLARCEPPPESGNTPLDTNINNQSSLPLDTLSGKEKNFARHHKSTACRIIDYLNERAGKGFEHTDANLEFVINRLKEKGGSEEKCRAVIDQQVGIWADDDKMKGYLRPKTLFNRANFSQYVGELGAKEIRSEEDQEFRERMNKILREKHGYEN